MTMYYTEVVVKLNSFIVNERVQYPTLFAPGACSQMGTSHTTLNPSTVVR